MMPDERRSVGLYTTVTPEEKALIDEKFMESGARSLRAYLRKMIVDGYIAAALYCQQCQPDHPTL